MADHSKFRVEISKDEPVDDLRKAVQFHLTEREQLELVNELLKALPRPTDVVEKYAGYFSSRREEGGFLEASPMECWIMAKRDHDRQIGREEERIFPEPEGGRWK